MRYNTGRFEPADQYIDGQWRSYETQTFQSLYLDIGGRVKLDLNSASNHGWNIQLAIFGSYYAAESLPTFSYGEFSYDMSEVISDEYRNSFVGGFNVRLGRDWQDFGVYLNYDYRGAYFKYSSMLDEVPGFSQGMSVIGVYRF